MTRTLFIGLLLAAGCSAGAGHPAPISLAQADQVQASTFDHATFSATASGGVAPGPQAVNFQVQGLNLQVQTGDRPALIAFDVPIGSVDIPATALPPHGLQLRDVVLHVEKPVAATVVYAQADAVDISVRSPLTLRWRMLLEDGSTYALGPARTEPVQLDIHVVHADSGYLAT